MGRPTRKKRNWTECCEPLKEKCQESRVARRCGGRLYTAATEEDGAPVRGRHRRFIYIHRFAAVRRKINATKARGSVPHGDGAAAPRTASRKVIES